MTNYITFNVVSTGDVLTGHEPAQVVARLGAALKLKPDQAEKFLGRRRTLKKGLMKPAAESLAAKLARLGIAIEVEKITPQDGRCER